MSDFNLHLKSCILTLIAAPLNKMLLFFKNEFEKAKLLFEMMQWQIKHNAMRSQYVFLNFVHCNLKLTRLFKTQA